ncbi:MAG TPA: GAF domain-containing protein, partial [Microlunatus sp.]|nr:GAF domain-containing protein [Microlunatus sp.]
TAARELVGARYGALGVLDRNGRLEQFVHVGMDPEIVAQIGDLPVGRGILGELIARPTPLRIDDLTTHPASTGFPPGHPPDAQLPRGPDPNPRAGLRQPVSDRQPDRRVHRGG